MAQRDVRYRIKLTVAVYKDKKLAYRNDMLVPTLYSRRSEARAHIKKEIKERLSNSNFFISPRVDFDLVRYTHEASCNTYLRYRITEEEIRKTAPARSGIEIRNAESLRVPKAETIDSNINVFNSDFEIHNTEPGILDQEFDRNSEPGLLDQEFDRNSEGATGA